MKTKFVPKKPPFRDFATIMLFATLLVFSKSFAAEMRDWTRPDGFNMKGELLQVAKEHLHVRIEFGPDIEIPRTSLIDSDWEWAMQAAEIDPDLLKKSPKLVERTGGDPRSGDTWVGKLHAVADSGEVTIVKDKNGNTTTLTRESLTEEDLNFVRQATMTPAELEEIRNEQKREEGKGRNWTSTDGRTITADFVRVEGESVVVMLRGNETPIPLSRLSEADRTWAKSAPMVVKKAEPTPEPAPVATKSPLVKTEGMPELLVDERSAGSVRIRISIPTGYHAGHMVLKAPDGFSEEVHHLDTSKLSPYLDALTELDDYVDDLSHREAQENEAKIKELARAVDSAAADCGIHVLAASASGSAGGRAVAAATFGSSRDTRSRDEKRADPLIGQSRIDLKLTQEDSGDWREAKSAVRKCLHLFSNLSPDTCFVYPGESVTPGVDAHEKRWGTWILEADGQVIGRAEVEKAK